MHAALTLLQPIKSLQGKHSSSTSAFSWNEPCLPAPAPTPAGAAGLLGIALANEEFADEAVQTQVIPAACRYFQAAVMTPHQLSTAQHTSLAQQQQPQQQQPQQQEQQEQAQQQAQQATQWDRNKGPSKSALKAAAAAAAASADGGSQDDSQQQQQQGQQQGQQQPDHHHHQQQQAVLPGNSQYLQLVATSPDGLLPGQEVLQLRLRKLLGVMRVLTCTGKCSSSVAAVNRLHFCITRV
jgi:type IV secretory pathway VirB10-like protein